jgi:endoglucanase
LEAKFFSRAAEAGFHSVRIPIRWSAHAQSEAPYRIDESFMQRVEWAVNQARKHKLHAIINIHHYEEIMSDPQGHRERLLGIWEQIASHFQAYPDSLIFELFNEPHDNFTAELWNQYLAQTLAVVRQTNPQRTVMIGLAEWGGIGSLEKLELPEEDNNLIVTFHYYNPFEFTHQGAEWVDNSDDWLGTTWTGTANEKQAVNADFDKVMVWSLLAKRPIHLGEFGAYSKSDMLYRAAWTTFIREAAEARQFSWAYWEFNAGFGIYDPDNDTWRRPLLNALIPETVSIDNRIGVKTHLLHGTFPNPFNPQTTIYFSLPQALSTTLRIYANNGQHVRTLLNNRLLPAGRHDIVFLAADLPSGRYFYQLLAGQSRSSGSLLLLK